MEGERGGVGEGGEGVDCGGVEGGRGEGKGVCFGREGGELGLRMMRWAGWWL